MPKTRPSPAGRDALVAPCEAPAQQALLALAAQAGHDPQALRWLLRSLNAHPGLRAHARVFARVHDLLALESIDAKAHRWGLWLPAWVSLLRWAWTQRTVLISQAPEALAHFDAQPTARGTGARQRLSHPLMRHGVDTYPVVAALWNGHADAPAYPSALPHAGAPSLLLPLNKAGADVHHAWLQRRVLLAYWDARWALGESSLRNYDTHRVAKEHLSDHVSSYEAGLALREFSLPGTQGLLAFLQPDAPDFLARLRQAPAVLAQLLPAGMPDARAKRRDWQRYLQGLQRFFHRASRVCQGATDAGGRRARRTYTGAGQRYPEHGFVPWGPSEDAARAGLSLQRRIETAFGPDLGLGCEIEAAEIVWQTLPAGGLDVADDAEEGDDPEQRAADAREPLFEWVKPSDYARRLRQATWGSRAHRSAAQHFAWDWRCLTPGELRAVWQALQVDWRLDQPTTSTGFAPRARDAQRLRLGALLVMGMLVTGQPLERLHRLRCWRVHDPQQAPALVARSGTADLQLVVCGERPLGWALPLPAPSYRTELPPSLNPLARPHLGEGAALLLPDRSPWSDALLAWLRDDARDATAASESAPDPPGEPQGEQVFRMRQNTAADAVAHWIAARALDTARITPQRLAHTLAALALAHTGDASLVWLLTGGPTHASEPRMYYTQHRASTLVATVARVQAKLLRRCGAVPRPFAPDAFALEGDPCAGARWVIRSDVVRTLLAHLRQRLSHPPAGDIASRAAYHLDYVLYTYLCTALSTGVRGLRAGQQLWQRWERSGCPSTPQWMGLADKELEIASRARLVWLPRPLLQQWRGHAIHGDYARQALAWLGTPVPEQPAWADLQAPQSGLRGMGPKLRARLGMHLQHALRLPEPPEVPLNLARALLRTELLERGVRAEAVDAWLGHANLGEQPWLPASSASLSMLLEPLCGVLETLLQEWGVRPVHSRFALVTRRRGAAGLEPT
jgi:hypothetical protein